jgi:hypothetical protein
VLTNICLITSAQANLQASQRVCRQHPRCRSVELRGLEPLTSSMPWPGVRKGQAAGDDGVRGRVGAATSIQPRSPSVCPSPFERRPRRPGADMLSLGRHPEGLLRLSLGQGLQRSSPLTTGVIAGVGRFGPRLSDPYEKREVHGVVASPAGVRPTWVPRLGATDLGCSVGCSDPQLGKNPRQQ